MRSSHPEEWTAEIVGQGEALSPACAIYDKVLLGQEVIGFELQSGAQRENIAGNCTLDDRTALEDST